MVAFQSGKKTKATLPISKHPLFPAMVALWFAALFGLGSLAIRPTLLEKFVLALRLDLVVPAAAPPLGFTSRILLALMMFVIGGTIGFIVARKIAGSGAERVPLRPARATAASFSANAADDEDFDRLAAARPATSNPIPGRRRALAMEEDYVNDYSDHAPLPGHEPQILDLATLGGLTEYPEAEDVVAEVPVTASAPLQIEPEKPAYDPWNVHALETASVEPRADAEPVAFNMTETQQAHRAFDIPAAPESPAVDIPAAEPSFAEPTDFRRPAFAAPEEEVAAAPASPFAEARPFEAPSAPRAFDPAPTAVPAPAPFAQPEPVIDAEPSLPTTGLGLMPRDAVEKLTSAPLASLGVVQLAERLALAIARRKSPGEETSGAAMPVAFTPAPPAFAQPTTFAQPEAVAPEPEVGAEPASEAISEYVAEAAPAPTAEPAPAVTTAIPRAMRPLFLDNDDHDEDDALESILPPRRFAMPAPAAAEAPSAPAEPEPVAGAPAEEEENFASLLGMKPSLRQSFVRVDEPVEPEAPVEPVVIFPGQAPRFASVARPFEAPAQPAPAPIAAEAPAPTPIEAGRRFDAPSTIVAAAPPPATAIDPEETERALKAALATLQRMSGAA